MSLAVFFWWMLFQNRQVPKGVGTEMRALVASWGLLLHDEGAWSAVELKPRVSRVGGRVAAVLTCLGVIYANKYEVFLGKTWVLEIGRGVPPIESLRLRKLSI